MMEHSLGPCMFCILVLDVDTFKETFIFVNVSRGNNLITASIQSSSKCEVTRKQGGRNNLTVVSVTNYAMRVSYQFFPMIYQCPL